MNDASSIDVLWIVIAASMVMLMQGGFTLLETGLVRAKNSINVAIKNFVDFCLSAGLFWMVGFGLMFGSSFNGWFGTSNFFVGNGPTPWFTAFFLFQMVFCGTATTIVSGAVAERLKFGGYLIIALMVAVLIYPVVGHWVWGGLESGTATGWLASRGFIDFAGGTVVHSVGGWVALAAVLVLGPRIGRFSEDSNIEGHNLPLATLGAFLLWFGWFGFNGGSTLAVTDQIPMIVVNTVMAGAFGGLGALGVSWVLKGQPDVEFIMNGALAGLVSVTASAHIVGVGSAIAIGVVGGIISFALTELLEYLKIDDAVGAVPVHIGGGIWGTLAVAIFSHPLIWDNGLTRGQQFGIQLTGIAVTFLWAFGLSFIILWVINNISNLRVSEEDEMRGLNVSEHGAQTALLTLFDEMESQRSTGDLSMRVTVEPHTEVGQIASQYNRVLGGLETIVNDSIRERDTLQNSIMRLLDEVSTAADGDLTSEAEVTEDATGAIADAFNFMIEQLRDLILRVKSASVQVTSSASEIQTTAETLVSGNESQAAQIVNTSAAIEEMALSIQQVSENAALSATVSEQAQINAERGGEAVQNTIKGMSRIRQRVQDTSRRIQRLGDRSDEIGEIVQLIADISERTSILALNASIQAALAGESGKSFAVVAKEVERLAVRSNDATKQIETLIQTIQSETREAVAAMNSTNSEVQEGSKLATEAGSRLGEIQTVSNRLADLIHAISTAAKQQARGSETIAQSMSNIADVTQQTVSGTQQASISIGNMAQLAESLRDSVESFKVDPNGHQALAAG